MLYVIQKMVEHGIAYVTPVGRSNLFWKEKWGYTRLGGATVYTEETRHLTSLPIDGGWIGLPDYPKEFTESEIKEGLAKYKLP